MAMNAAVLSAQMTAAVLAAVESDFINIADDHTLKEPLTTVAYWTKVCTAISTSVVNHITTNARCSGVDSGGDSHNLVGIV